MGIFSGLGGALGKAAIGQGAGSIAAEKENYRRNQIKEERAYRKELTALKKQESDPYKDLRGAAKGIATTLNAKLLDWQNQGIINSPAMVPRIRAARNALQHTLDFLAGKIQPEDFDTNLLRQDPTADAADPTESGGLGGAVAPAPAPVPSPAAAPSPKPAPGASPFVPNNQVNAMLDATPRAVASMGSAYPAGVAGQVASRMALGALGVPFPQPSAPEAAPKPVPQPKPKTPIQKLKEFIDAGPPQVDRGYMTDPQWRAAKAEARQSWESQVKSRTAGLSLEDRQRLLGAQADKAVSGAKVAPELDRQRVVGGVARIEGTRAQTGLNKALTPIKVGQGKATLAKTKQETKLAPERLQVQKRQASATERQASASEGRLRLEGQKFEDQKNRFQISLQKGSTKGEEGRLKERLKNNFKIFGDKRKMASGSDTFIHSDADRAQALKDIKRDQKRLDQVQRSGNSSSLTFRGKPDQVRAVLGGGVAKVESKAGGGKRTFAGHSFTWREFLDEGLRRGKKAPRIKELWAGLK